MIKFYLLSFIAIVALSCATKINYVGTAYAPTEKIDVFVDENAIRSNYDIVGKGYIRYVTTTNPEKLQTIAVEKARQKGVDAVLIKDHFVPSTEINTTVRTDTVNKGVVKVGHSQVSQGGTSQFVILFLKYR